MRALLVEDEQVRIDWFRAHRDAEIVHCYTVEEAIMRLRRDAFDELWLDHDLGTEPKGGRDVATWLIANPTCQPALRTITHTVNTVSGPKIVRELTEAGRPARWIPFSAMQETP